MVAAAVGAVHAIEARAALSVAFRIVDCACWALIAAYWLVGRRRQLARPAKLAGVVVVATILLELVIA